MCFVFCFVILMFLCFFGTIRAHTNLLACLSSCITDRFVFCITLTVKSKKSELYYCKIGENHVKVTVESLPEQTFQTPLDIISKLQEFIVIACGAAHFIKKHTSPSVPPLFVALTTSFKLSRPVFTIYQKTKLTTIKPFTASHVNKLT